MNSNLGEAVQTNQETKMKHAQLRTVMLPSRSTGECNRVDSSAACHDFNHLNLLQVSHATAQLFEPLGSDALRSLETLALYLAMADTIYI